MSSSKRFDIAFLRFSPYQFATIIDKNALKPRRVDPSDVRTAVGVFNDLAPRSLQIDLSDISRDRWSLTPGFADVIAELRTKRFGTITYARSASEPEDINVFDRKRRRNISIYPSAAKLANGDVSIPKTSGLIMTCSPMTSTCSWRPSDRRSTATRGEDQDPRGWDQLADVEDRRDRHGSRCVLTDFGRLLHLRVVGQNSIIVNLPEVLRAGTELWLDVRYGGPSCRRHSIAKPFRSVSRRRRRISGSKFHYSTLPIQQSQLLVPAIDGDRLCHRYDPRNRSDRLRRDRNGQPVESPTLPPAAAIVSGGEKRSSSKRHAPCVISLSSSAASTAG
jgi:hypothetical protein